MTNSLAVIYKDADKCEALQKAIESVDKVLISLAQPASAPYQLCPKCNGDGHLGRYNPPAMASTSAIPVCDVCRGAKVITQYIIKSEQE